MFQINIILFVVGPLAFPNLATAVSPIPDENTIECNYTSEGAQWRKDCNWCRCTETGHGLCTRRGCPQGLEVRLGDEKECIRDARWRKDCNWCSCINERAICTSKYCGPLQQQKPKITRYTGENIEGKSLTQKTCRLFSESGSWKDDCNWCRCLNGTAHCTKQYCPPSVEEKSEVTSDCNGELVWKKGCNWCECVEGFSICTPEECAGITDVNDIQCVAGSGGGRWRNKDCNWCNCGGEGLALCTKKLCRPSELVRDSPVCEGDVIWKEFCNWCRCIDGKAKCSKHKCDGSDSNDDKKCEDGQTWVEGCNNCFCNQGSALCTRRACLYAPINEIQPVVLEKRAAEVSEIMSKTNELFSACKDGSRWMKGCNWCSCANETAICTLRACIPGYEDKIKPPFCDEISQWRDDCNICRCANGVPVCTKKDCRPVIIVPPVVSDAPGESSKHYVRETICTEGSRWKVDCNWCFCSNGLAACTIMGCLPGFRNEGPVCDEGSQWKGTDGTWCKCKEGEPICQKESVDITETTSDYVNAGKECTEGSKWRKECNWCSCSQGRGICTLRACLPGNQEVSPDCHDGSEWRGADCSWCHCEGGKSVCEPSTCSLQVSSQPSVRMSPTISLLSRVNPIEKKEIFCAEGSRWTQLCNWCTCSTNGIGLCEQRACLSDSAKEMDKSCEGNSKWKIDCNWCTCENGKGICTHNDCSQGASNDPVSTNDEGCRSGSSWLEDCNICICTNNTAVCTKKECSSQKRNLNHCSDGEVWQEDCNSCQCINGEGACTKKLCPLARDNVQLTALCYLPPVNPDVKLCGGFETKWTYNSAKGKCEDVIYGGCGGTENLFSNQLECQTTCGSYEPEIRLGKLSENPKERCFLPVVPGPCYALKIRYAFFPERNRCEKFHYGGCQGNQNNFESVDECYSVCGGNPPVLGKKNGTQ